MSHDRAVALINKRLPAPTDGELASLKEHGAESWGEYIAEKAAEADISVGTAFSLFQMLGPSEAFDGFVTSLEDAEMMGAE